MAKAITWLLCTYVALKLIQYVFGGRAGLRDIEPSFREKLLRGEPILFAIAFGLSVPTAIWSSWSSHRSYAFGLGRSVDCYGKLRALYHLPEIDRKFGSFAVMEMADSKQQIAFEAAKGLRLDPRRITAMLAQKQHYYTNRYSALARRGASQDVQAEAVAVERCFRDDPFGPWSPVPTAEQSIHSPTIKSTYVAPSPPPSVGRNETKVGS